MHLDSIVFWLFWNIFVNYRDKTENKIIQILHKE